MKKNYEEPTIVIVEIEEKDIIRTSDEGTLPFGDLT